MGSGVMRVEKDQLENIGNDLQKAGVQLFATLGDVKNVVDMISNGAFEGEAAQHFVSSFRTIQPKLDNFAQWMESMGKSIITSAENSAEIDRAGKDAIIQ